MRCTSLNIANDPYDANVSAASITPSLYYGAGTVERLEKARVPSRDDRRIPRPSTCQRATPSRTKRTPRRNATLMPSTDVPVT